MTKRKTDRDMRGETLTHDESGQISMFFALMALPLLAAVSAGLDYSNVVRQEVSVKAALDSAVIAAANNNAIALKDKPDFARTYFEQNYNRDLNLKVTADVTRDTVSLTAEGKLPLMLGRVIGVDDIPVYETSKAKVSVENTICVMALSETASGSIRFDTDIDFSAKGCTVHTNSRAADALVTASTAYKPAAHSFCATGGVRGNFDPAAKGECATIEDPYKNIPGPTEGECAKESMTAMNMTSGPEFEAAPPSGIGLGNGGGDGNSVGPTGGGGAGAESGAGLFENPEFLPGEGPVAPAGAPGTTPPMGGMLTNGMPFPPAANPDQLLQMGNQYYTKNNIDGMMLPVSMNLTGNEAVLRPGTYCNGLTVDGQNVRFLPGDYLFTNGPLTFLNMSHAEARGVTFAFKGKDATLNIESGSKLTITAPKAGPRRGLAFMQVVEGDRAAGSAHDGVSRIVNGGQLNMAGTAYLPTQKLEIEGDESQIGAYSPAVGLIAGQVHFRGGRGAKVVIQNNPEQAGLPPLEPRAETGSYLVE